MITTAYKRRKIKQKHLSNGRYCRNCGESHNLQLSHVVPVGQNKSLETAEENTTIHCHDCHHIWEHESWENKYKKMGIHMIDLVRKIRELDPSYYGRIIIKMPDWLVSKIEK